MSKRPSLAESMKAVGAQTPPPAAPIVEATPMPAPDRAEGKRYHAATRAGMKRVTVVVEPEDHRRVKRLSADTDRSIEDLMREALADLLQKHNA
ncbi:Ribbon-helix-helix protein, CopG family [Hyphomicrobiales bacterium]|uniref:ribbon-helix-helix domain-containing protein n=1 Tax=Alphaproteobacteria TaxID=28211 RepID=UPI0020BE0645|nr:MULTISPECIES: ribbon-helix-helix domain-containing protein [Hyphomicrobiales]CAH1647962.1 Ribbon-helix-helix protein, CopG family [Hyphomicrobiales bacterium]MDH0370120.1 ribbon-helix-helix protein, CopG family [Brucella anthropi]CAH1661153.1 Ribbon-helix-helix protein, CopG family [Hyphomicrobiales bacterium]CAH1693236.1 Ribbon-helix-helix protein, CopG family [Hyphomicrobiales bacterium]CAH1696956.1 Ribbon-helix-helix protein, CopG family [Hyphomicrobiales bacterium]